MANLSPIQQPTPASPAAASLPLHKVDQQLEDVDLILVAESTTNPRKTRNEKADKELVESIRLHGVLQPVLVRRVIPTNKTGAFIYELVAGSRRFRAAKEAGLKKIPATIRQLTDEQALELQIIENLQREDVAPLEEGQGYTQLLAALAKKDPKRAADGQGVKRQDLVVQIAQKVGKSARYVYARMKLCELIPELQKDLLDGRIDASHADELVRLTPKDQKQIRDWGLYDFEREERPEDGAKDLATILGRPKHDGKRAISIRNLKVVIERDYQLTLDKAKFDTKDPNLKPLSCWECPKNTGVNPLLPAAAKPTCTDKVCWRGKMRQHVEADARELAKKATNKELVQITLSHYAHSGLHKEKVKARPDWKSAKPGECKFVQPAVQVDDSGGEIHYTTAKTVCANKQCRTHWGAATKSNSSSSSAPTKPLAMEDLRESHEEAFDEIGGGDTEALGLELLKRTVAKVDKLGAAELRVLADYLAGQYYQSETLQAVLGQKNVNIHSIAQKAKVADLPRTLIALTFAENVHQLSDDAEFLSYAHHLGVDAKKVASELVVKVDRCVICGCFKEHGCDLAGGKRCAWVVDDRLKKVGLVCSNPLCVAEAKKKAGIKDPPAKKAVQASAKPKLKAKAAKGGRA